MHVSKGATCFNLEELPVKHWAMSMAQKHVLVVDHSKFGKVRPARMGDLKRFDIVVSDCCPEDEYVKYAQTQRIVDVLMTYNRMTFRAIRLSED